MLCGDHLYEKKKNKTFFFHVFSVELRSHFMQRLSDPFPTAVWKRRMGGLDVLLRNTVSAVCVRLRELSALQKKDPRLILIWFVGLFSSVLMDSFSDVSLGICGIICAVPGVFCFGDILEEYTEYKKQSLPQPLAERRKGEDRSARSFPRRIIKANDVCISLSKCAFALFLVVVCANTLFEGFYLYKEDPYKNENTSDLIRIECGPYRGIYTTKSNQDAMNRLCEDMETIKKMSDGPLFSEGFQPLIPLYLDMPYSNCTTWNLYQPRDRQLRYFAAHPEKTPDVIYYYENLSVKDSLPDSGEYSENAKTFIEFVNLLCDGTVTNGKAGIMIKVQKWKDPSDSELLAWVEEHKQIGESILQ